MGDIADLLSTLPSYLQDGVNLSEKEKLAKFDDLKTLYEEMVEKVACFEMKCEYIDKEISMHEINKAKLKKKKVKNTNKTYEGPNFDSARFEPYEGEDPSLPDGWKTGWRMMDGFSKGSRSRVFWDSNGRFCYSRVFALHIMKTEMDCSDEEINKMKTALFDEGWSEDATIPDGWLINRSKKAFLNQDFDYFRNPKAVIKHIMAETDFSENALTNFLVHHIFREKIDGDTVDWRHDDLIPSHWKVGSFSRSNSGRMFVLTPDGNCFHSRATILEAIESSELRIIEKESFKKYLVKEKTIKSSNNTIKKEIDRKSASEGKKSTFIEKTEWIEDADLPSGWRYADVQTDKGILRRIYDPTSDKSFYSTSVALRHIASVHGKSSEQFKAMKTFMMSKDDYFETEYLPKGFMLRQKRSEGGFFYLTDKLEKIYTLTALMDYLKKNNFDAYAKKFGKNYRGLIKPFAYPKSKLKLLKKKRSDENAESKNLSKDEASAEHEEEEIDLSDSEFEDMDLDPDNESIESKSTVDHGSKHLDDARTSDDEMETDTGDETMDPDYEEAAELEWTKDSFVPRGWKVNIFDIEAGEMEGTRLTRYQSPCGNYFGNLPDVLKFLETNDTYSEFDKNLFKRGLSDDGWKKYDGSWHTKFMKGRGLLYLSPEYEIISSDDIENHLREAGKSKQEIEEFMKKSKEVKWKIDSSVPSNWKIGFVQNNDSGELVKKFQSPTEEVFDSRPDAIKYMIESKKFTNDDITRMQLGMSEDDWMFDENLPVGWFKKKFGTKWYFSTSKFQVLKSTGEVMKHFLQTQTPQHVIQKFSNSIENTSDSSSASSAPPMTPRTPRRRPTPTTPSTPTTPATPPTPRSDKAPVNIKQEAVEQTTAKRKSPKQPTQNKKMKTEHRSNENNVKVKKEKIERLQNDRDPCELPPNWRFENEDGVEVIYNDKGAKFRSRREATEFMIKQNYNPKQIYAVWTTLDTEGWDLDNDLIPPGWRLQHQPDLFDYKYITREVRVLHSTDEALKHIKNSSDLSKYEDKFQTWSKQVKSKEPKMTWKSDSTVPSEWCMSSGLSKVIFKCKTTGGRFESRKDAIDFMIKESQSSSNIFTMWNSLDAEGWISDEEHLPRGWRRKYVEDLQKNWFLSPMMEVVRSSERFLNILKSSNEYQKQDVKKFEEWSVLN